MSPFTRAYYTAKPFLPRRLRIGIRRWVALRKRPRVSATWPILPGSEQPPVGWPGWPHGKEFALVLTHDVESQKGLDRVKRLAELEMSLGFRSSFNFVPDGEYQVPDKLRHWLTSNGFEVGVHDHRHDGKLYSSHDKFKESAREINHRLKEWGAVGFRSGFMLRRLEWLHGLDIAYDSSTFDTDPFEPQPDGVGTIFPFWVPRSPAATKLYGEGGRAAPTRRAIATCDGGSPSEGGSPTNHEPRTTNLQPGTQNPEPGTSSSPHTARPTPPSALEAGYVELPYTLPQDFTLFILLKERTTDVWKCKLNWIASHGGMALLNVHPDYLAFEGTVPTGEYSADLYLEFLRWMRQLPARPSFQTLLPREAAAYCREFTGSERRRSAALRVPLDPPALGRSLAQVYATA